MLGPLRHTLFASSVVGIAALNGIYGARCREFLGKDRPKEIAHKVDPRIVPSKKESVLLKATRMIDITAVRWAMKYLVHVRNKVHHYNVPSLFNALDRPEGVGLLTVCNHVSTLDSASLVPAMIPSRFLHCSDVPVGCVLSSRNCGYWNLAAEEIMFSSPLKAALSSLIKVMPVDRNGGVFQMALADFAQRAIFGDWIHMFPEGRTYQDQLMSCRDALGRRYRKSGRTAPPGRDLGPMKWGVGKVIYDVVASNTKSDGVCVFEKGVNNGKLIVLPYYHLNMEKVLPENEDLSLVSFWPRGGNDIFCMFGEPVDFSDIISSFHRQLVSLEEGEEKRRVQYACYKAITDRVEERLERLEYCLKEMRERRVFV